MDSQAEKYLSGKNFEDTCKKMITAMDDLISGAVFGECMGGAIIGGCESFS